MSLTANCEASVISAPSFHTGSRKTAAPAVEDMSPDTIILPAASALPTYTTEFCPKTAAPATFKIPSSLTVAPLKVTVGELSMACAATSTCDPILATKELIVFMPAATFKVALSLAVPSPRVMSAYTSLAALPVPSRKVPPLMIFITMGKAGFLPPIVKSSCPSVLLPKAKDLPLTVMVLAVPTGGSAKSKDWALSLSTVESAPNTPLITMLNLPETTGPNQESSGTLPISRITESLLVLVLVLLLSPVLVFSFSWSVPALGLPSTFVAVGLTSTFVVPPSASLTSLLASFR